ncbi:MAG TPA: sigma-70 family RNA polymerase sigma factor, partial [Longimicrobiales bacterium]|nr:sigma-70 family RNA polymerase sigma factor [Longimicrobiales bacterium]
RDATCGVCAWSIASTEGRKGSAAKCWQRSDDRVWLGWAQDAAGRPGRCETERFFGQVGLTGTVTVTATILSADRVSEPDLIARVLAGDQAGARLLYDRHAARVYRLAFRLTGDADLAREATQDVFVRAFRQLDRFRGESVLATWLHRITVTVAATIMRRVKRIREREHDFDELQASSAEASNVDPVLRDRLHRAIDALPEIYRATLIMHDLEGYTHSEIADALGVAEGTCKSRLFLARAKLRAALGNLAEELE